MTKEIFEIIDTVVKIGLGALISGVSTYLLAKKNQEHELRKMLYAERLGTLKGAVKDFEESSSILQHACTDYVDQLNGNSSKTYENIINEITKASNLAKNSRTNLHFIGFKALGDVAQQYWDLICDLKESIQKGDGTALPKIELLNSTKDKFLNELSGALFSL